MQVRTIFVLGFPPDVKERELQNLLRWWPGYEASQMNFKADQPMGFALFSTSAMAMAARDALQVGCYAYTCLFVTRHCSFVYSWDDTKTFFLVWMFCHTESGVRCRDELGFTCGNG